MKTTLQQGIEEFYREGGRFDGKTMISRTAIVVFLQSLLPAEREIIEQAHRNGSKKGYLAGSNDALNVGNKTTTAIQDAADYYNQTFTDK